MPHKQIIQNSIFGVGQYILTALLTLISVPIFIHNLGLELYGIFAVVSVVGNLNLLTNFGLNGTLLIFISKQGKCRESDHDIIVTFVILSGILALFSSVAIFYSDFIVSQIFQIPAHHQAESRHLLIYLVIANAVLLIGQTYTSVLDALQKIHITNIYQFLYSVFYWGGMIVVVSFSHNLSNVGLIALCAAFIWFIGVGINTHYIWGKLDIKGIRLQFRRIAKKQLTYGTKLYASGMVAFLFEPLSKILLSNFIGLNAVALFEIGIKIRSQIYGVISKAIYPIFPYISSTPKSRQLSIRIDDLSKTIQLFVLPISLIIYFCLPILLVKWLGTSNLQITYWFVSAMTISLLIYSTPVIPIYIYLNAKGYALLNFWVQGSSVIINAIIFFIFKGTLGIYTILFANTLAYIASYSVCVFYQKKFLQVKRKNEFQRIMKLIGFVVIGFGLCQTVSIYTQRNFNDLILFPLIVSLIFILFVRKYNLINEEYNQLIYNKLLNFRRRFFSPKSSSII